MRKDPVLYYHYLEPGTISESEIAIIANYDPTLDCFIDTTDDYIHRTITITGRDTVHEKVAFCIRNRDKYVWRIRGDDDSLYTITSAHCSDNGSGRFYGQV
ncbi:hypothetical protein OESDEN_07352 [Oesophagostomum dentatum]|uniref:Uncharacterized protein n=1 Tax=Oesophagostomum dentatum TaxID=61180 RepID=A0A0B1T5C0_OESDE|nr:hypothetical protein OESDEN_07352 [Oesophagostomum dentatum]